MSREIKFKALDIHNSAKKGRAIISDTDINRVHGRANFGAQSKRSVVNEGVLKCASGYHVGSTAKEILKTHQLITDEYELTAKGRQYLYAVFEDFI